MAVSDYSTSPIAGANFNLRTDTPQFALGITGFGTANTSWIYVRASEVVATGTCTVNASTFLLTDAAGNFTADTAFASGEYGWVRRTTATLA